MSSHCGKECKLHPWLGVAKVCGVTALALLLGCSGNDRFVRSRPSVMRSPFAVGTQKREMRVISLTPNLTETVFALNASGLLVGVTDNDHFPVQAEALPSVGDMNPNLELIVASCPDLVILDKAFTTQSYLDMLKKLKVHVLALEQATLSDVERNLPILGGELHRQAEAERLLGDFRSQKATLSRQAKRFKSPPRVFVAIWSDPLTTAGQGSFVDELLTLAGAQNVFAQVPQAYPVVSSEDLLLSDPEVIILTSQTPEQARYNPGWSQLQAVRQGHVYYIDPDLLQRPTVRSLQGALQIQQCLSHFEATSQSSAK